MKLLYIHQYFVTAAGTSGTRSYDVSRHLVEMGHEVTVLCAAFDQNGLPRARPGRFFTVHNIDGIRVVVCNVAYSNRFRVPRRLWSFLWFAVLATWAGLRERSIDLIFATSTPLTVGIPARVCAALRRRPYIFEVRDLWPEDLLAAGRLRPGWQYRLWSWLESFCYAGAWRILLVSRGFHQRLLQRGLPGERLQTIVLGADGRYYDQAVPDTIWLDQHGLAGKVIAVYAGAHGDANGLDQVLDAAANLADRPDVAFVLLGDGKAKPRLRAAARARGLTNVHFLDPVAKQQLPGVLKACHVGLMILKQIPRPRWVTPNKVFDYMFAELPTIVNFAGTTAELVDSDGTGVASVPGSAEDLAGRIRYWADHPAERAAVGRRAAEVARARYDRRMIARQLADVFNECLAAHRPALAARRP